ncbi:hypothetical protein ACFRJ9_00640 [Paenarthrobacter sp. NPDC056912]|uniref:hypothetical protein n=1 Tax=Paenarthrobacter sp. NPDC056912 TaxID=3345965 RepID=UPI00366D0ED6
MPSSLTLSGPTRCLTVGVPASQGRYKARLWLRRFSRSIERPVRPVRGGKVLDHYLLTVHRHAAANALKVTADPFGIFHGEINQGSDGPLEVYLPVDALLPPQKALDKPTTPSAATQCPVAGP